MHGNYGKFWGLDTEERYREIQPESAGKVSDLSGAGVPDGDREGGEKPVWNRADYLAYATVRCLLQRREGDAGRADVKAVRCLWK